MIIREYEYEKNRPWNCQERFIEMKNYNDTDEAWQDYKNRLFGNVPNILNMSSKVHIDTIHEDDKNNALCFEFELSGRIFVHVAQDWTIQFDMTSIIEIIYKEKTI